MGSGFVTRCRLKSIMVDPFHPSRSGKSLILCTTMFHLPIPHRCTRSSVFGASRVAGDLTPLSPGQIGAVPSYLVINVGLVFGRLAQADSK